MRDRETRAICRGAFAPKNLKIFKIINFLYFSSTFGTSAQNESFNNCFIAIEDKKLPPFQSLGRFKPFKCLKVLPKMAKNLNQLKELKAKIS